MVILAVRGHCIRSDATGARNNINFPFISGKMEFRKSCSDDAACFLSLFVKLSASRTTDRVRRKTARSAATGKRVAKKSAHNRAERAQGATRPLSHNVEVAAARRLLVVVSRGGVVVRGGDVVCPRKSGKRTRPTS